MSIGVLQRRNKFGKTRKKLRRMNRGFDSEEKSVKEGFRCGEKSSGRREIGISPSFGMSPFRDPARLYISREPFPTASSAS